MSKVFADFLSHRIPGLSPTCKKARLSKRQVLPIWDCSNRQYIYNLETNDKFSDKHDLPTLLSTLETMKFHASIYGVSTLVIPKIGCGLGKMSWQETVTLLRDVFAYSDIHVVVYTQEGHGVHALSSEGDLEFYVEDEVERYSEEVHLNEKNLETDFTRDLKACQPTCDEQFPSLTEKEVNNRRQSRNKSFNSQVFDKTEQKRSTHSTENYVGLSQHYKLMNTISLDLPFRFTFIVTTKHSYIYGGLRDNYIIEFLDTRLSSRSSKT